jgi:hypothetical protein
MKQKLTIKTSPKRHSSAKIDMGCRKYFAVWRLNGNWNVRLRTDIAPKMRDARSEKKSHIERAQAEKHFLVAV